VLAFLFCPPGCAVAGPVEVNMQTLIERDGVPQERALPYEQTRLYRLRHSAAHVMAEAVLERFPQARLAIGPPIKDGFYYDFDLGTDATGRPITFTPDDVTWIEARMQALLRDDVPFAQSTMPVDEALAHFADQPYKVELIEALAAGQLDEDGQPTAEPVEEVGIYQHRRFVDLCRGPHVARTGDIPAEAAILLRSSGAYWRGDENRPQLQRLYGTAWETKDELDAYLARLAEAERRDHRRLGQQLELFHFDESAPGMPYWLPRGLKLYRALLDFWREEHEARGYQEISAPIVNHRRLWDTSGHWEHFKDEMFIIPEDEHNTYCLKPMNCPNAMIIFGLKTRSYRDLPLRLADCDNLFRNERSGTLHGLLRVQQFRQDDAHNFVTEDQIEDEMEAIFDIADRFYHIFGLRYTPQLATRPDKFIGDVETWDRAEDALRRVLERRFGAGNYQVHEGDGAFYGPKIDILMHDALERDWQMGTIQLDFQLPRRFNLSYVDANGQPQTPVVVHRVIYGSMERFIGLLIEHTGGAFPLWIAPVQAAIIPITDRHIPYAEEVNRRLKAAGLRSEVDDRGERMAAKIRDWQLQKVPYMLIAGDREEAAGTVAVRTRDGADLGPYDLAAFIALCQDEIAAKS
jgi:threonyl-tRNA synthetase